MSEETVDTLSRTLRIVQRRTGHRATSDDVLLAWAGAEAAPSARRVLDLGSGKGTVALLLCRRLPACRVVGVEADAVHHGLALRNAALNGLAERYEPRHLDLRAFEADTPYDLVCGAPPFMPVGSGVLPRDPQRAAGRFELRGGIEDYARAARRALATDGRAVLLMDGRSDARTRLALEAAGLGLREVIEIRPRPARPATYRIYVCGLGAAAPLERTLTMRGDGEAWSAEYATIRAALDLPG